MQGFFFYLIPDNYGRYCPEQCCPVKEAAMKRIKILTCLLASVLFSEMLPVSAGGGTFAFEKDAWQIHNARSVFRHSYYVTEPDFLHLKSVMSPTELWNINWLLQGEFMGSCFGLSATAVLGANDKIDYSRFAENAASAHDAFVPGSGALPENLESFISCYMVSQLSESCRQYNARQMYSHSDGELFRELLHMAEDGSPVLVCFNTESFAHAVVGYDAEYGTYEVYRTSTQEYETFDGKLSVYDSNSPKAPRNLYFHSDTMEWYFPQYGDCQLCFVTDDLSLLNDKGLLEGTDAYTPEDTRYFSVFSTDRISGDYTVEVYSRTDGSTEPLSARDCKQVISTMESVPDAFTDYLLPDFSDGVVMHMEQTQPVHSTSYYKGSIQYVCADAAGETWNAPWGYAAFNGEYGDYTLALVQDAFREFHTVTARGTGSYAALERTETGWLLRTDSDAPVQIQAENAEGSRYLYVQPVDGVVNIYAENGRIVTEAGQDAAFGDVTGDAPDAVDAARILTECAERGSGMEGSFSILWNFTADTDKNGSIDATDAARILEYSAARAADATRLTFEEYLWHSSFRN